MLIPERRELRFRLDPKRVLSYHPHSREANHLLNALSVLFPEGERFFIESVRQHRDEITDPELIKAITGFIGQEAMHGREHEALTTRLAKAGMPADEQDAWLAEMLRTALENLPRPWPLAYTIALEHFTATLAALVLEHPELTDGVADGYRALWQWHALEESEHKSVAYDVWAATQGARPRSYLIRVSALLTASLVLFQVWSRHYRQMRRADQESRVGIRSLLRAADFLVGRVGVLRRGLPLYLDYFRPGFHPWDHGDPDEFPQLLQEFAKDLQPYMAENNKPQSGRSPQASTSFVRPPTAATKAGVTGAPA